MKNSLAAGGLSPHVRRRTADKWERLEKQHTTAMQMHMPREFPECVGSLPVKLGEI
jgi:hypothetical protein